MRYDVAVYFQKRIQGEYEPSTGDYGDDTVEETKRYANVTDSRTEFLKLQYGDLKEGNLIVRLQNHYCEPFDLIRIGEKTYKSVSVRNLRTKNTFIVAEVQ